LRNKKILVKFFVEIPHQPKGQTLGSAFKNTACEFFAFFHLEKISKLFESRQRFFIENSSGLKVFHFKIEKKFFCNFYPFKDFAGKKLSQFFF